MDGPTRNQLDRIGQLLDEAGSVGEFLRWVRSASHLRPGRPSFNELDRALIAASMRAARESGVPIARLLRLNVQMGVGQGASMDSTVRRLQRKARSLPQE